MDKNPLLAYVNALPRDRRAAFIRQLADRAGVQVNYLRHVLHGRGRRPSPEVAMQAEILSDGAVTRSMLLEQERIARIWPQYRTVHPKQESSGTSSCSFGIPVSVVSSGV